MIALLLLSIVPVELTTEDRVDLTEINHFYDERGKLIFEQVIFYNWCWAAERYQVLAWRRIKNSGFQLPVRDWTTGDYVCGWKDGERFFRVRSYSLRETWTQYDPELAERAYLPKERRLGLRTLDKMEKK